MQRRPAARYRALQPAVDGKLKERERHLERLLVVSPVPAEEDRAHQLRKKAWAKTFSHQGEAVSWMEIPFHAPLLLGEELLSVNKPTAHVALRYAALAKKLDVLRDARTEGVAKNYIGIS